MAAVAAAHGIKLGGRELALLCQKVEVGGGYASENTSIMLWVGLWPPWALQLKPTTGGL
jgi:hypothetical protein